MSKFLEIILIFFLALFSFCLGVKYSSEVKEKAGWMLEVEEVEEVLPELANPENPEIYIQIEENSDKKLPAEKEIIAPSIQEDPLVPVNCCLNDV